VDAASTSRAHPFRFEALLEAVLHMAPQTDFATVQLVSSSKPLREIFSLAEDERTMKYPRTYTRIDIEVIGQTVFLNRWFSNPAAATRMTLPGCGRGFEKQCTRAVVGYEDCMTHHRIDCIRLAGMTCLLQYEVDAFIHTEPASNVVLCPTSGQQPLQSSPINVSALSVCKLGNAVAAKNLVEIKSRSKSNGMSPDVLLNLWLTGVSQLFLGWHEASNDHRRRTFAEEDFGLHDMTLAIAEWEEANKAVIGKFFSILKELYQKALHAASLSKGQGDKLFALVYDRDERSFTLRRRLGDRHALPAGMEKLFQVEVQDC